MQAVYHLDNWYEANRHLFDPPVCNKLQHKRQMTIMYVGGPNVRTDFHLDQGSEFFWQVRGNMELPTIQQGKRKVVRINEGDVFCLPSRIPHSPQRPEQGALGLVIERERYMNFDPPELDGLRWFIDFENTDGKDLLYEKFFHCGDLGRDLVPVVKAYHASEEKVSRKPGANVLDDTTRPFVVDEATAVPEPFSLEKWIDEHATALEATPQGIDLFHHDGEHPDKEFQVLICSSSAAEACNETSAPPVVTSFEPWDGDTWVFQLHGSCAVSLNGADATNSQQLLERCGGIVPPKTSFTITRGGGLGHRGSIGMVVRSDPLGNKSAEQRERQSALRRKTQ